jgi:hypothetical protein
LYYGISINQPMFILKELKADKSISAPFYVAGSDAEKAFDTVGRDVKCVTSKGDPFLIRWLSQGWSKKAKHYSLRKHQSSIALVIEDLKHLLTDPSRLENSKLLES